MKAITTACFICIISVFAILIYFVYYFARPYITKFEKGQVWIYETQPDNRFDNARIDTNVIIDVKENYIMYKNSWKDSAVESKRIFLIGSRLINKAKP